VTKINFLGRDGKFVASQFFVRVQFRDGHDGE
jgi:hypothetical protein